MEGFPFATLLLSAFIAWVTNKCFKDPRLRSQLILDNSAVRLRKNFYRLITSGLLHRDWKHFALNVIGIFIWGHSLEIHAQRWGLLLVFFVSVIGGNTYSLYRNWNKEYVALGASGGCLGIVFCHCQLLGGNISPMLTPGFSIPSYVFAIAYLIVSFIAMRRNAADDNVGHEAHIGGALTGFLCAFVINPDSLNQNPEFFYSIIGLVCIALFIWFWKNQIESSFLNLKNEKPKGSIRHRDYDQAIERYKTKKEIDALLDKVSKKGIESLSPREKFRLEELSRKI